MGRVGSFGKLEGESVLCLSPSFRWPGVLPYLVDGCLLPMSFHIVFLMCVSFSVSKFLLFIKTPAVLNLGPILVTSC